MNIIQETQVIISFQMRIEQIIASEKFDSKELKQRKIAEYIETYKELLKLFHRLSPDFFLDELHNKDIWR